MGLFDKLRGELVDIIEWMDDTNHTLVWRFPRYHNQIKQGAQLIVRPGQVALFIHQGKLADVFQPGTHELKTGNLPILSTLAGWKYGFDSPFKSEVYFVRTTQVTDLKWGTPNPIMLRDPDFGPIRLRAFGSYTLRAVDPEALLKELVGTDSNYESDEISELLRSMINSTFAEVLGKSEIAALDLAANYARLSEDLRRAVVERVDDEYGLDIPALFIVNISLPPEVEKAIDARSSMGVIGNLAGYQQYQMGRSMPDAASNPGGGAAGAGMGLGMGMAMANQMVQGMGGAAPAAMPMAPPPPPQTAWHVAENGKTSGPFNEQQVAAMASSGQLTRETTVWSAGMAGWTEAGEVAVLAGLFPAAPPPPPPA